MAEKKVYDCTIVKLDEIATGIFDLWLKNAEMASTALPGQFVNIKCADQVNTLLRRPISICDVQDDATRVIFQVKGEGTRALSKRKSGEVLSVMGPAGRGFTWEDSYQKCALIGGGIGTFPLLYLAKKLPKTDAYLGFRNQSLVVLEEEFKTAAKELVIATDDGSYGFDGFAIDALAARVTEYDMIYACGPKPMLKAVQTLSKESGVPAQLSLEQRMGCGIGACLVCACKVNGHYNHVCKGGPVFKASEVDLDD